MQVDLYNGCKSLAVGCYMCDLSYFHVVLCPPCTESWQHVFFGGRGRRACTELETKMLCVTITNA